MAVGILLQSLKKTKTNRTKTKERSPGGPPAGGTFCLAAGGGRLGLFLYTPGILYYNYFVYVCPKVGRDTPRPFAIKQPGSCGRERIRHGHL